MTDTNRKRKRERGGGGGGEGDSVEEGGLKQRELTGRNHERS